MAPSRYFYASEDADEFCLGIFDNYEDSLVIGESTAPAPTALEHTGPEHTVPTIHAPRLQPYAPRLQPYAPRRHQHDGPRGHLRPGGPPHRLLPTRVLHLLHLGLRRLRLRLRLLRLRLWPRQPFGLLLPFARLRPVRRARCARSPAPAAPRRGTHAARALAAGRQARAGRARTAAGAGVAGAAREWRQGDTPPLAQPALRGRRRGGGRRGSERPRDGGGDGGGAGGDGGSQRRWRRAARALCTQLRPVLRTADGRGAAQRGRTAGL
eukprot:scaffold56452_cov59-Phaeocystis_antarctica.AAC.7